MLGHDEIKELLKNRRALQMRKYVRPSVYPFALPTLFIIMSATLNATQSSRRQFVRAISGSSTNVSLQTALLGPQVPMLNTVVS